MKSVPVGDFVPYLSRDVSTVHFQVIPKKTWSVSNFSKHIQGVNNVLFWPCGKKILSYQYTRLSTCLKHASSVAAIKTKQQGRFLPQQKKTRNARTPVVTYQLMVYRVDCSSVQKLYLPWVSMGFHFFFNLLTGIILPIRNYCSACQNPETDFNRKEQIL